jgi:hypothetical protein
VATRDAWVAAERGAAGAATALRASLPDDQALTAGERLWLVELLDRRSACDTADPPIRSTPRG